MINFLWISMREKESEVTIDCLNTKILIGNDGVRWVNNTNKNVRGLKQEEGMMSE